VRADVAEQERRRLHHIVGLFENRQLRQRNAVDDQFDDNLDAADNFQFDHDHLCMDLLKCCPCCNGLKTMTVKASNLIDGKFVELPPIEMTCIMCNGTGEVTTRRLAEHDAAIAMWCKCEGDNGVDFYKDYEHPEVSKHHYRCKKCKKVVQVG